METLRTMSEIGVTIAGFATLATILQKPKSNWELEDTIKLIYFYTMIEIGVLQVLFCYIPIILSYYYGDPFAFRLSTALGFVIHVLYFAFLLKRSKSMINKYIPDGIEIRILFSLETAAIVYILFAAIGVLGTNYEGNYVVIVLINLTFSLYLFLKVIYHIIPRPNLDD